MSIYPRATYRPCWTNGTMNAYNLAILHVTASEARSQYGYFSNTRVACSHFHVAKDGTVEQYVNTAYGDAASYRGNRHSIGIETQGLASGSWTPAQVDALARLLAWCNQTHGIPLTQVPDSRNGRRGIGYHAQGVPANSWQKSRGISQTGGELWSPDIGKVCPGPDRIKQIPGIITKAKQYAGTPGAYSSPDNGPLVVDGYAGAATITKAQRLAGTPADGVISSQPVGNKKYLPRFTSINYTTRPAGSTFVKALQTRLNVTSDGYAGPNTVKALQSRLGVSVDGYAGPNTVTAWQKRLNGGKLI